MWLERNFTFVVLLDYFFDDIQTEAGAFFAGKFGCKKRSKDFLKIFRFDTNAVIYKFNNDPVTINKGLDA